MTDRPSPLFQKLLDTGLPLGPRLREICGAAQGGPLILRADPGSGKTTLLPLALMARQDEAGEGGKILMLEPRRAAALGAAARMADILGENIGGRVGYAVRLERKTSSRTRIEVLTEGLLVRRLQGDPALRGVNTIIFDEFHERSIHADLALALCLDLRRMGSKVSLIIMSATLDPQMSPFGATMIDCPGRVFPVEISYIPLPRKGPLGRECAHALADLLSRESTAGKARGAQIRPPQEPPEGGDLLLFLPGRAEIAQAAAALGGLLPPGEFEVLPLHGSLPLARQREITTGRKGPRRRIILSTNLAETSLTIPGITVVVDSGLTRLERYHLPTGMNRLVTEMEDRSSAEQRAGRAGRLEPGRCIRLWAETEARPEKKEPEIRRIDLSAPVLECLLWGVRDREALPWPDTPSAASWDAALELLRSLGAVEAGGPSPRGREMARLGIEPRLAALCIAGRERGRAPLACAAAALLSLREPQPPGPQGPQRGDHYGGPPGSRPPGPPRGDHSGGLPGSRPQGDPLGGTLGGGGDFRESLGLLRGLGENPGRFSPEERAWARRVEETAQDLLTRLYPHPQGGSSGGPVEWNRGRPLPGRGRLFSWGIAEEAELGELLAAAFPDRLCKRQEKGLFRFPSGREARIEGPLEDAEWLAAAEADAGERRALIRRAAPLSPESALAVLGGLISTDTRVLWQGLVPRTVARRMAGKILLAEERRKSRREEAAPALRALLEEAGLGILPWEGPPPGGAHRKEAPESPRRLLERILFFLTGNGLSKDGPPDKGPPGEAWTGEALKNEAAEWLGPFLWEHRTEGEGPILDAPALKNALLARFGRLYGPEAPGELDKQAPSHFTLPNGRKRPLDYGAGEPALSLRIQDAFGIKDSPRILGRPLLFRLLSPADRPLQTTADLAGFWAGSYADVRREMRGRYPRHFWPEDPRRGE